MDIKQLINDYVKTNVSFISVETTDDLVRLSDEEFTGNWRLNKKRAEGYSKIIIISKSKPGNILEADILRISDSPYRKNRVQIYFCNNKIETLSISNKMQLKFSRNPVKYHNIHKLNK